MRAVLFLSTLLAATLGTVVAQTPSPLGRCRVADPSGTPLNLRTSPYGTIVGALPNGLPVGVVDQATDGRGDPWVLIAGNDGTILGWVFRRYLSCPNEISITDIDVAGAIYYVDNTRPPDAFLALRTQPSTRTGAQIMQMPNGTPLQILQRRPDRWWYVRVVSSGQTGWAKSRAGKNVWIYCCISQPTDAKVASPTSPRPSTPPPTRAAEPKKDGPSQSSSGTGFFVSAGHILTNNHVVKDCGSRQIVVSYPERKPERAYIAGQDETNDLAILFTALPNLTVASFRLAPKLGEPVATYGFPLSGILSSGGNFTLGNITSLAGLGDDTRVLQTSTPIQPGNSGGPLLDMRGNVVGVMEFQLNAIKLIEIANNLPQNVNFAIQSAIIVNFLGAKGISPTLAEAEGKILEPPSVADIAKSFTVQILCD